VVKLLLSFLISIPTFATVTITGVSGVSKFVQNTDGSVTIYGGIQGGNISPATFGCLPTSGACNTCLGNVAAGTVGPLTQHRQMPCNMTGVFKETILTFAGIQTTNLANGKFLLCNGTTEIGATVNLSSNLAVTWSDVCLRAVTAGDNTCATNINQTITFGVGTDCNNLGNEKVNVKVITRHVNVEPGVDIATVNTYTPPPIASPNPDPAACTTTKGACFFRLFPGDGKVYVDRDLAPGIASDFPATDATGVTYDNLVFFLLPTGTSGEDVAAVGNDFETFNQITTATELYGVLSITASGDVSSGSIDGLTNESRYCFKMGSQDTTGNIDHISSTDCTAEGIYTDGTSDCRNVCTSPSEVVGLLTDTSCFIATAAYGSSLDPHVNLLRDFKNQYLVPHWAGRKVIKAYYSLSPQIAKWVAKNEVLKSTVRILLWPIIGLVQLINLIGLMITFFISVVAVFGIFKWRKAWN
jgi:hypothetical protein